MPRLVVKPGSPGAWEIQLKPGKNSFGRSELNDFPIPEASVSSKHCEILVSDDSVTIKDLGSTNGTFVDGALITETELSSGQSIRFGEVELAYFSDAAEPRLAGQAVAAAAQVGNQSAAAVGSAPGTSRATRITLPSTADSPPALSSPMAESATAPANCRFHPNTLGRFFCPQCRHHFCELCVTSRLVGGTPHKYCRHCGGECRAVQVRLQPKTEKGFFARLPDAFPYPVRGAGALIVIAGIIIFALLKFGRLMIQLGSLRSMACGVLLEMFAGGYLFTYLQGIIHSTVAEERELPDLPGLSNFAEDIVQPFFRLFGLFLCCFVPALAVAIWAGITQQPAGALAFLLALGFGGIYFPMAFLAMAILDSIGAANPLVVVPSILKAPTEYLMCLVPLACSSAVQSWGGLLIKALFPDGWMTHSMGTLLAMLVVLALMSFLSFYLIILSVHLLGLLYLTKKAKLGWLTR
jgi:hypothetical protein